MTTYLMNNIPDYIDDRIKIAVVLSGNVSYQLRSLANSNEVSSWYDPEQHRAFTTIDINEVPEQFKSKLIQHSTSTGSSTLMYPRPAYSVMSVDTGTIVHFNQNPSFVGQSFYVWWDSKNKPDEYEEFSDDDPISDHPHDYGSYGKYVVAFSTNVTRLNMNKMLATQFEVWQGDTAVMSPYFSISSLTLQLSQIPYFEGDELSIQWDAYTTNVYTHSSPLSSYQHAYDSYGEKNAIVMKSSGGYVSVDVLQMFPNEQGLVFIESIKSRNNNHVAIDNLAFSRTLKQIDCAKIESIATQWYDCYELTSISLPQLTSIDATYAVNCMPNLKSIYAPRLKQITNATSTFKGNIGIEKLSFPSLESITGRYATFAMNAALSSVHFPSMVSCNNQCFDYCVNLADVDFSSLLSTTSNMFRDCISLAEIRLPKVKYIASSTFNRCQNLKTIDLRDVQEVPTLVSTNALSGLPSDYKILVNPGMVGQFKAAANWKNSEIAKHISTT